MGLIKAGLGAVGGVLGDQWKEFFYCDSIDANTLMVKGQKRLSSEGRSSNTSGEDNIISNGSRIAVNNGQCMIIVEQGRVVEVCNEPGEYVYDTSTEPSVFTGDLKTGVSDAWKKIKERFTMGGDPGKDQRVYYFNMKEILGNKYGTPSEVPFKSFDNVTGQVLTMRIRCFGEYSYHIMDPLLFYTNVAGNAADCYTRDNIDSMLRTELRTALQPAFAKLSALKIDYTELPGHTMELADALNEVLSQKWRELRGIEIVSFGVDSIKANEDDEAKLQKVQMAHSMANPNLAMGAMADSTSDAMRMAAQNEGGMGAMGAFMGMNMAGGAGTAMYGQMAAAQQAQAAQQAAQPQAAPAAEGWTCACGKTGNTGKFCAECGKPKPEPQAGWTCSCGKTGNTGKFCAECGKPKPEEPSAWTCACGTQNTGKFCMNCGKPKPEVAPSFKCSKCGWVPEDPTHPPKFCPQCGDPFDDADKT